MCEENGFKFLNSAEVLRDDATGWAKKDYTLSDGVHLSKEAVTAYLPTCAPMLMPPRTAARSRWARSRHRTVCPANLINKDPIAVRGAKVPLEFVAANGGKLSGTTSQLVKKAARTAAVMQCLTRLCLCGLDGQLRRQLQQRDDQLHDAPERRCGRRRADSQFQG